MTELYRFNWAEVVAFIYDIIFQLLEGFNNVYNTLTLTGAGVSRLVTDWLSTVDLGIFEVFVSGIVNFLVGVVNTFFGSETPFIVSLLGGAITIYVVVYLISFILKAIPGAG